MNQKSRLIVILVAAIIVGGGIIVMVANSGDKKDNSMHDNMPNPTPTSSKQSESSQAENQTEQTSSVDIKDFAYAPASITVKVGTTVTWTNMDEVQHNVVADTSSSDAPNGPLIGKGETYKFTFNKAGTYSYHCQPHPYMRGTVVVTN